jgi:hypothetical protein
VTLLGSARAYVTVAKKRRRYVAYNCRKLTLKWEHS